MFPSVLRLRRLLLVVRLSAVLVYVLLQAGGGYSVSSAVSDNVSEFAFMDAVGNRFGRQFQLFRQLGNRICSLRGGLELVRQSVSKILQVAVSQAMKQVNQPVMR